MVEPIRWSEVSDPNQWVTCEARADWITPADIGMQSSVSAEDFKAELDRLGIRSRADLR